MGFTGGTREAGIVKDDSGHVALSTLVLMAAPNK